MNRDTDRLDWYDYLILLFAYIGVPLILARVMGIDVVEKARMIIEILWKR